MLVNRLPIVCATASGTIAPSCDPSQLIKQKEQNYVNHAKNLSKSKQTNKVN